MSSKINTRNSLLSAVLLFVLAAPGLCDTRWESIGPPGGDVRAIAVAPSNPSVIYAGARYGGVFRSADGGRTWKSANGNLEERDVESLAVDPRSSNVLYAGFSEGGIFKSVDAGQSWSHLDLGIDDRAGARNAFALAIHPSAPETVYAGLSGEGVFKSTDGGVTWRGLGGLARAATVVALAIDPLRPATIFAGTCQDMLKSADGGASWISVSSWPTCTQAIAIDPVSPDTIYVGIDSGRILRSTDGARSYLSWSLLSDGAIPGDVTALLVDPRHPATLYAGTKPGRDPGGIFRTTDLGGTWSRARGVEIPTVNTLAFAPGPRARLLAGIFAQGLLASDDGLDWSEQNSGLNAVPVTSVAQDRFDPDVLYVARADVGVSRTRNGGRTWKFVSDGLPTFAFHAVAADPRAPGVVYAGWADAASFGMPALFRSTDYGESWAASTRGIPDVLGVMTLAFRPSSTPTLFAGTTGGVYRSGNGFGFVPPATAVGVGAAPSFAFDPTAPQTIYTPTFFRPGICPGYCPDIPGEIAVSRDGGDHWTSLPNLQDAAAVVVDPTLSTTLYAGVRLDEYAAVPNEHGLFVSTDSGQHWKRRRAGLGDAAIAALAAFAEPVPAVYAGSPEDGVFRSLDGGETWTSRGAGLEDPRIRFLTPSNDGKVLFAGTVGGGLYQSRIADSTGPGPEPAGCEPTSTALCLAGGRFEVRVDWTASNIPSSGVGQTMPLTADTGAFWFFQRSNIELVIKVLDGRAINGHFWVFFGALSDVAYTITVTDTETGVEQTYTNPQGTLASRADTEAF